MERLKGRRWEYIRSKWLHHIPHFPEAGCVPQNSIDEISGFTPLALRLATATMSEFEKAKAAEKKTGHYSMPDTAVEEELPGLREAVFAESLFLLHKARHVVGTAEIQVCGGVRTWALANAYQGAFFAAKATLGFLGVTFPEYQGKAIAADLFPYPVKSGDEYTGCAFHYLGVRMDHRQTWEMYQRLLGVSVVEIWPKKIVNKLKSVESKYFAKQRNDIHYKNNGWILGDLNEFDLSAGFGDSQVWDDGLDFDRDDISMGIALSVLKLGMLLVQDLEKSSAKLTPEIKLLSDCVESGRHPMYGELLLSQ
jgi:hypothetical protein